MSKKIVLVGHCGPDSSYLRSAVRSAVPGAQVAAVDDETELRQALQTGVDLILFNRELDYGFRQSEGVELIASLKKDFPATAMMLISNYPEAQAAAEAVGAAPGFGKREIGSPRVKQAMQNALRVGTER